MSCFIYQMIGIILLPFVMAVALVMAVIRKKDEYTNTH